MIRYDFDPSATKKSRGRRIWDRAKWAIDVKSIDGLRGRIMRHNVTMNLILTSVGKYGIASLIQQLI